MDRMVVPKRWRVYVVLAILGSLIPWVASQPQTAEATGPSHLGRAVARTFYGVHGEISGITDPYADEEGLVTAELFMARRNNWPTGGGIVQVGWTERPGCPVRAYTYWQNSSNATGWACWSGYNHANTLPYGAEYDGNNDYWCFLVDGDVKECRYLGWGSSGSPATYLYAFGATNHNNAQMGGPHPSNQVTLSKIKYKPGPTSAWNQWNNETSTGSSFISCTGSPCRYNSSYGQSSGALFTRNWSEPPSYLLYSIPSVTFQYIGSSERWQQWQSTGYRFNNNRQTRLYHTTEYMKITNYVFGAPFAMRSLAFRNSGTLMFEHGPVNYLYPNQGTTYSNTWAYGSTSPTATGGTMFYKNSGYENYIEAYSGQAEVLHDQVMARLNFGSNYICHEWHPGMFNSFYTSDNSNC